MAWLSIEAMSATRALEIRKGDLKQDEMISKMIPKMIILCLLKSVEVS